MASVETLDQLCKQSLTKKSTNNTNNCHRKQFLIWVIFLTSSKNMKKINIINAIQDWSKTPTRFGVRGLSYPDMSQIMKPPAPKWPHFPLLHQFIAERTTTATTADVKNTLHIRWLLHLQQYYGNTIDYICCAMQITNITIAISTVKAGKPIKCDSLIKSISIHIFCVHSNMIVHKYRSNFNLVRSNADNIIVFYITRHQR